MSTARPWYVYLLECADGSYYAGVSVDVAARFATHCAGKGARYTRAHPPLRVLASRAYPDRSSALRAEWQLKQQPRARKQAFLNATDESDRPSTGFVADGSAGPLPAVVGPGHPQR